MILCLFINVYIESSMTIFVRVQTQDDTIELPNFAHTTDACADVRAFETITIQPMQIHAVATGLHFELPEGYEMQIRPRSGLAIKHGISILNAPGTLDADYRGELKVILINFGVEEFTINKGDRIAQLAVREVPKVTFVQVDTLSTTKRGSGGFGSTGIE